MPVERAPGGSSLIDVLDRILDKGIIIDAWVRISLVASIETYLRYADALGLMPAQRAGSLGAGGGSVDAATTRSRSSERA
jgi:hypothetical protein